MDESPLISRYAPLVATGPPSAERPSPGSGGACHSGCMFVPFSVRTSSTAPRPSTASGSAWSTSPTSPPPSLGDLTYAEVADLARRQAARLDELGLEVGDRVAVVSHNCARLLTSFFGVGGSGRVLVPVNFRLRPDEVAYIVAQSGARVLYVDPELDESLRASTSEHRFVLGDDDDMFAAPGVEPRAWEPDENATACINYTSGTTARPKGVQITHRNIWVNAVTFAMHAAVTDRDVYLHTLPMFHANGWGMPFAMTGLGVKQVVLRKVDGAEILRRVRDHGVTVMCAAPAVVARPSWRPPQTWEGEIPGRDRVRIIMAGAPPPTKTVVRVEEELGWEFVQIYGLTETSPLLTFNRTRAEWDDLPAEERATKLTRAGPRPSAYGCGRTSTARCWRAPTSSSRATGSSRRSRRGRWTAAGSTPATAAIIGDDGYLTISDRKKDVIITGGENVSSIEVEDVLFSHPAVAEVAVIGVPSEKWGETIKALVVLAEGADGRRGRADRLVQGQGGRLQGAHRRSSSARCSPARRPASSRSSSCASPTGRAGTGRSTEPAALACAHDRTPSDARRGRRPAPRLVPAGHRRLVGRGGARRRRPGGRRTPGDVRRRPDARGRARRRSSGAPTCWSCTTRCSSRAVHGVAAHHAQGTHAAHPDRAAAARC